MKALVTGGAGFIGHHLVRALVERGDKVAVLDDFSAGRRERLAPFTGRIALMEGDVRDAGTVRRAIEGSEVVFHEAALASVARSVDDPRLTDDINVGGTIEVMLAAARAGARRVILAGSSAVYGDHPALPTAETEPPNPRSPYAASKLAAEMYMHSLGRLNGVETVALRYFNVFGSGQDPEAEYAAVVPRWLAAAWRGARPMVFGDGSQTRDFLYVDNVVSANLLAASADGVSGLTFNIGAGERRSLLDLLDAISAAVGRPMDPEFGPIRRGDVPHSQADISLATGRLGYRVLTSFRDGIAATARAFEDGAAAESAR